VFNASELKREIREVLAVLQAWWIKARAFQNLFKKYVPLI
jgi:hypothetical protein